MSRSVIAVAVSGRRIAIDASHVLEVVGARAWMPVAETGGLVVGAMAWQGGAIAVLDLGRLTGLVGSLEPGARRRRTPVVSSGGLTAALPVDAVHEAVEVTDAAIAPAVSAPFCVESVELEGERLPLLDAAAALEACRMQRSA